MQHFVLTRFNIASPGREAPIRNTPGWLTRRFELFETYCLPSMAGQDVQDFCWLIYFDEQTPEQFRQRIRAAQAIVPFHAVYVETFRASLAAHDIAARLDPSSTRVLTTRLDNDDAVSHDFLARIRNAAATLPDGTMLNFSEGVALRKGRLYSARDESNPFTSLIEGAAGAQTIWAAPHTELVTRFPTHQIVTDPCWLQVVHDENVANRIKGKRLTNESVLKRFCLASSVAIEATPPISLLLDRLAFHPARYLREATIATAKTILRRH